MRTFDKTALVEEELQDLKLRYELLGSTLVIVIDYVDLGRGRSKSFL
jgi:hypothetical protein